jgi:uncharacterized membrane protein YwaF
MVRPAVALHMADQPSEGCLSRAVMSRSIFMPYVQRWQGSTIWCMLLAGLQVQGCSASSFFLVHACLVLQMQISSLAGTFRSTLSSCAHSMLLLHMTAQSQPQACRP